MPYPKTMTTQKSGQDIIKKYEKLVQTAYFPTNAERKLGIYTIGYGHRDKAIKKGETWSIPKCEQVFKQDVIKHEKFKYQVTVPLTQNQFDALSSFSFNLGGLYNTDGTKTQLLILLNKGDYKGASNQLLRFTHQGTTFMQGLLNRRRVEKKLFDTPTSKVAPVKTVNNQSEVNKANAQKQADLKNQKALQDKLTAQDRREEVAEKLAIKKAELTKNNQAINIAKAKATANALARKNAQDLAKQNELRRNQANELKLKLAHKSNNPIPNTKSSPTDSKAKEQPKGLYDISKAKVLKSGLSIIGLIALVFVMSNAELEKTELE